MSLDAKMGRPAVNVIVASKILMRFLVLSSSLAPIRHSHSFIATRRFFFSAAAAPYSTLFFQPARAQQQQQQQQQGSLSSCPPLSTTSTTRTTTAGTCRQMTNKDKSSPETMTMTTGFLNAKDAAALDVELMTEPGFSLEQLMELAGLSCAEAIYQVVEEKRENKENQDAKKKPKILLVCGPGNNGGDGLVAARHLVMFGYDCEVVYPKQSKKQHFINLIQQCTDVGIPVTTEMPSSDVMLSSDYYTAIVDAIFGFSFKGEPREPFATILQQIRQAASTDTRTTVFSVDVPSGWNVDEGDVANTGFVPDVLISLTTPKHCSKSFEGRHFLGGRFLPPKLAEKYGVQMPPYPGVSQVMEISSGGTKL